MIRLSTLLVLLMSLSFSCRTAYHCRDCTELKTVVPEFEKIPFSDSESILYKVKINLYSMYFSGLLAMRNMGGGQFRMSLMSETGFKLFDMEILDGDAKISNVFPELDRPNIINTFEEDFASMVFSGMSNRKCTNYSFDTKNDSLFVCKVKDRYEGIVLNNEKNLIKKIWKSEKIGSPYFEINYGYGENGLTPDFITIVHSNVRLRIELAILEKK
jgi:hypothetical protein